MAEQYVTAANFAFLAKLLREQCGISLEPGKEYLVNARLTPLIHKHGLTNVNQLIERLRSGSFRQQQLLTDVVEAMVTTETLFFRDIHPFETLKKHILPDLIERRRAERKLNIWCAASSSGQKPYSLAILLQEYFPALNTWQIHLWGTDVSQEMLERSRAGRYSQLEVNRGLPTTLLLKWFRQEAAHWYIDDRIRKAVTFTQLNLAEPWPPMPAWDLVFLRNVMIYFDNDTKKTTLERLARVLCKDGYLLLGGAETTLNLSDLYCRVETLNSGFYQLKAS